MVSSGASTIADTACRQEQPHWIVYWPVIRTLECAPSMGSAWLAFVDDLALWLSKLWVELVRRHAARMGHG